MARFEIQKTDDGSLTLYDTIFKETFHSKFGARSESEYVFIEQGLKKFCDFPDLKILEIGFGTGFNAFLTFLNKPKDQKIFYEAIELFPIEEEQIILIAKSLHEKEVYLSLATAVWNKEQNISSDFILYKRNEDITKVVFDKQFDLVYFDAFSPKTQPELWTLNIFQNIHRHLRVGGALVTYASSGIVKQNLRNAGFIVERLPGPPHKHHMLRASKI